MVQYIRQYIYWARPSKRPRRKREIVKVQKENCIPASEFPIQSSPLHNNRQTSLSIFAVPNMMYINIYMKNTYRIWTCIRHRLLSIPLKRWQNISFCLFFFPTYSFENNFFFQSITFLLFLCVMELFSNLLKRFVS